MPTLEHTPYPPDLAQSNFSLFSKLKSLLKGTHYQSNEDIHKKMAKLLKPLSKNDFRRYFQQWKAHMWWSVASDGNSFEGYVVQIQ
jgi:hypothetical protein